MKMTFKIVVITQIEANVVVACNHNFVCEFLSAKPCVKLHNLVGRAHFGEIASMNQNIAVRQRLHFACLVVCV